MISTAIFPIYFESVASDNGDPVVFWGYHLQSGALYSYSLSISFLLVAVLSPLLSGIADYTGKKKRFLQFFCYLGSAACCGLFFYR
ncbi:MAG: MFS transporter [Owenweeksia sp.]|nr:MFS transporter [Owenweeksia sp.]